MTAFLTFGQIMRHPVIELYHLFNLLQMLNDHGMVDIEFFSSFSCSSKRISFSDPFNWLFSTSNDWSLCSSSSRPLSPLQNCLNHCYIMRVIFQAHTRVLNHRSLHYEHQSPRHFLGTKVSYKNRQC